MLLFIACSVCFAVNTQFLVNNKVWHIDKNGVNSYGVMVFAC